MKIKRPITYVFLIVSLATFGQTTQEDILGSWQFCKRDGSYMEVHILNNYFRIFEGDDESMSLDFTFYYSLSNHTIYYSNKPFDYIKNDSTIRKSEILVLNPNKIRLNGESQIDTLYRIDSVYDPQPKSKSIEVATNWYDKFRLKFNQRLKEAECVDIRSLEEKDIKNIDIDQGEITTITEDVIYIETDSVDNN